MKGGGQELQAWPSVSDCSTDVRRPRGRCSTPVVVRPAPLTLSQQKKQLDLTLKSLVSLLQPAGGWCCVSTVDFWGRHSNSQETGPCAGGGLISATQGYRDIPMTALCPSLTHTVLSISLYLFQLLTVLVDKEQLGPCDWHMMCCISSSV